MHEIAKALRQARTLIRSGDERFICFALDRCFREGQITYQSKKLAVEYVNKQLDGCSSLGHWLQIHRRTLWDEKSLRLDFDAYMRKIRLQWIDHMVEVLNA